MKNERDSVAELPVLETDRLIIVPFAEHRLTERYVTWLNDPEVVRFSEQRHTRHTVESCREFLDDFTTSNGFFSAIVVKETPPTHIGNIVVYIDAPNRVADVSILIGEKDAWGKGYGCEAWSAVVRELLENLEIRKVAAGAMAANAAILSVMRRSGMKEESRWRRHFLVDGQEIDMVYAARFADDTDS